MMTIKNFAEICNCNTQTLRYYDRMGLLRPARVDIVSGYRYYEDVQLIDFVRIKNLQLAEFSIQEIKELMRKNDVEVLIAFQEKIKEQEKKLKRMIEIQKSYLQEKEMMEKMIHEISNLLISQLVHPPEWEEFGLEKEKQEMVEEALKNYFMKLFSSSCRDVKKVSLEVDENIYLGSSEILRRLEGMGKETLPEHIVLSDGISQENSMEDYITLWERHDWTHVNEFIQEIPSLENGKNYCFLFQLIRRKPKPGISYALCMIGAMLLKCKVSDVIMRCKVEESTDESNHFMLMLKKQNG